ncbi:MAG: hypothetical protein ACREOD_02995 [Candidatus Dormibacteria bacterium]
MSDPVAVFLGPDPVPALASGLDVICADACGIEPSGRARLAGLGRTGAASSADLLEQAPVRDRLLASERTVVVWKSSARLERQADELGLALANSPAQTARRLENKAYFAERAPQAGLPIPPSSGGPAGPELLQRARALPGPWVFQLAHSFSGEHTYPAPSGEALAGLMERFRGRLARVATRVEGLPVTVTGAVGPERVVLGRACLQLTGLAELTPHPLGSCGNDFSRPVPESALVDRLGRQAGEWLGREGHRGLFGLDLVLAADGRAWCLEVNPRLVASVPLWSLSARDLGEPGPLDQHLACLGLGPLRPASAACHWSQVILYQRAERRTAGASSTAAGRVEGGHFRPTGPLTLEGPRPGQMGLVVHGRSRPGREMARLIFRGAACASGQGDLVPWLAELVTRLRRTLEEQLPPLTAVSPGLPRR